MPVAFLYIDVLYDNDEIKVVGMYRKSMFLKANDVADYC